MLKVTFITKNNHEHNVFGVREVDEGAKNKSTLFLYMADESLPVYMVFGVKRIKQVRLCDLGFEFTDEKTTAILR